MSEWVWIWSGVAAVSALAALFIGMRQFRLQQRALARNDVKEVLTGVIAPLLHKSRIITDALGGRRFYSDQQSGWKELYGKPESYTDSDLRHLQIGTYDGRRVYRIPEMDVSLRDYVWYVSSTNLVSLRFGDLNDRFLRWRITRLDSRLAASNIMLIKLAANVARVLTPHIGAPGGEPMGLELQPGRSVSDVWVIGFNWLLMKERAFSAFLTRYNRTEAKEAWELHRPKLIVALAIPGISEQVSGITRMADKLIEQTKRVEKGLLKAERRIRNDYHIPYTEVGPIL